MAVERPTTINNEPRYPIKSCDTVEEFSTAVGRPTAAKPSELNGQRGELPPVQSESYRDCNAT
jgi:hypothetical protein